MTIRDEADIMTEEPPKEAYTRTMNKAPVDPKNVKIRTTSFDNVLMRNIKLTQVPSFLIQHVGSPGYYRFENFLSQKLSSFAHTNQGYGLRWLYVFCGLSLLPNFYATYVREKRKRDMLIKLKYGEKGIDHLDPIEKGYVLGRVTRDMNKPHFA